jgi:hypothetical protein
MQITEKMQKVIDLGNEFASQVFYEQSKVKMTFVACITTPRRLSSEILVAIIHVDTAESKCTMDVRSSLDDILWFSGSIVAYHGAITKVKTVFEELRKLNYFTP